MRNTRRLENLGQRSTIPLFRFALWSFLWALLLATHCIAGDDGGSAGASLKKGGLAVETEIALLLFLAVAFQALVG